MLSYIQLVMLLCQLRLVKCEMPRAVCAGMKA